VQVSSYLRKQLPYYMVPEDFHFLEKFPLNMNGKVDRSALPDEDNIKEKVFIAPESEIEKILANIWQSLLQVDQVSRFDNFFELGGHSLLMTRLSNTISLKLGLELPLKILFENSVLMDMALVVSSVKQLEDSTHDESCNGDEEDLEDINL